MERYVGHNVREIRQQKNMTQAGLAKASKLTVWAISRIEQTRTRWPQEETVKKLAQALDVSIDRLYEGVDRDGRRPPGPQPQTQQPRYRATVKGVYLDDWTFALNEDGSVTIRKGE